MKTENKPLNTTDPNTKSPEQTESLHVSPSETDNHIAELQKAVEGAYANPSLLDDSAYAQAVEQTIDFLNRGRLRVAEPDHNGGGWKVNIWVKEAVLLYFRIRNMVTMEVGPFEYRDKIPIKSGLEEAGVRVVPPGVARYGSFLEPGAIMMPSYVNIGAWVGSGTMVDTWATVGSCAQVGRRVHLSGGVGIGGVLEPPQALPTIIEDDAFIGSRCVVVEGALVEREAVLGAGCVITASTRVIDVSSPEPVEYRGRIPSRSVVIPGMVPKQFPAGTYHVGCALIIGKRRESTDLKTSLNQVLRDYALPV